MDIGLIGLGNMGFPMARRLIAANHQLVVFDTRKEAMHRLGALGAQTAHSPKDIADRVETVMASLPSLQASLNVATGKDGVIDGTKVKRFVDLSTVGSQMAVRIHDLLAARNIVQLDSPVSGGVGGAEKGTLAVMVSGPKADFEAVKPALEVIGCAGCSWNVMFEPLPLPCSTSRDWLPPTIVPRMVTSKLALPRKWPTARS